MPGHSFPKTSVLLLCFILAKGPPVVALKKHERELNIFEKQDLDKLMINKDVPIETQDVNTGEFVAKGKKYKIKTAKEISVFTNDATYIVDGTKMKPPASTAFRIDDGNDVIIFSKDTKGTLKAATVVDKVTGSAEYFESMSNGMIAKIEEKNINNEEMKKFFYEHLPSFEGNDEFLSQSEFHTRKLTTSVTNRKLQTSCSQYKVIDLALAFESSYCSQHTDLDGATAEINNLVAIVSAKYQQAGLCTKVKISHLEGHCDPNNDPYKAAVDLNQSGCGGPGLLNEFRTYWVNNRSNVQRDSAHLISGTGLECDSSGCVIGCAYVGVLCNQAVGYGVNYVTFTGNTNLQAVLLAHELGHNAAANHYNIYEHIMYPSVNPASLGFSATTINSFLTHFDQVSCIDDEVLNDPTQSPTIKPSPPPTKSPTKAPTKSPTKAPTKSPTKAPTNSPTKAPTKSPTKAPTMSPTKAPTPSPTKAPTKIPTANETPTKSPTKAPTKSPTIAPTKAPTKAPTNSPTKTPTVETTPPTTQPTPGPTTKPTQNLTTSPSAKPSTTPTKYVSQSPSTSPSSPPSARNTSICGDGVCGFPFENKTNCPVDCAGTVPKFKCGDGVCNAGDGEDCRTCPEDCSGKLNGNRNKRYCCGDSTPCSDKRCRRGRRTCSSVRMGDEQWECGDGICTGSVETAATCSNDCTDTGCCGDGICNANEDCTTCPQDCRGKKRNNGTYKFCCGGKTSCSDRRCRNGRFQCTGDSSCTVGSYTSGMATNTTEDDYDDYYYESSLDDDEAEDEDEDEDEDEFSDEAPVALSTERPCSFLRSAAEKLFPFLP